MTTNTMKEAKSYGVEFNLFCYFLEDMERDNPFRTVNCVLQN